ncbi:O-methyltransferase [Dokdonia sp. Hel_I_53]|uniref:O-methyltransferase n=1 Tax=Dokdonia sp. Hel_I_53 TaxID=1566287 RepID=UPI001199BD2C|nr:class I SAM-dependent methyltransferase [Dokdonia sp. Hel_I_53]TVZ51882.1 putative O-methyltransferase YrrM [Dokdonia sp. Hel_I_53]
MIRDLHTVIAYLKWLPKTFHLHGIHSPFIFNLEKKVLRGISKDSIKSELLSYQKSLLNNNKTITVRDYGYGSRVFNSEKRAVRRIVKVAGATQKRRLLLQRLVHHFRPSETLELGTSLGLATTALAIENKSIVTSIEGCRETAAEAQKNIRTGPYQNVTIICDTFENGIKSLNHKTFDLIYFDGNHSKKATLAYFQKLLPTVNKKTVWIFDDIHWSPGMTQAWEEIKGNKNVTATVDCFWFGMVFFRPEQAKEDFYIRL